MDGAEFGLSPPPWEIPVPSPQMFTDRVETRRVPHSSIVKVQTGIRCSQLVPGTSRENTRNIQGKFQELLEQVPGTSRHLESSVLLREEL